MSEDESQSYSAANLTRIGSDSEEDQYEEEGWEAQQLLDLPVPGVPPPLPLDPRPPLLHANTRRATTMAGNQIIPVCSSTLCRGCTTSCQEDYAESDLWCDCCKAGRWDLCDKRDRCREWTDNQFQHFQDLQTVARSGALREDPPPPPMSSAAPALFSASISRPVTQTASTHSEVDGAIGGSTPLVPPVVSTSEQVGQSQERVGQSQVQAGQPEVKTSSIVSVRPKLVDKTSPGSTMIGDPKTTSGAPPPFTPPFSYSSKIGVPVGGGRIQSFPDNPFWGYGSSAISPFPPEHEEEGIWMESDHPESSMPRNPPPWMGDGIPEQTADSNVREELWRKTRNVDLEDTNESFASPMTQTPTSQEGSMAEWQQDRRSCRGRGLLAEAARGRGRGRSEPKKSILKPPTFLPPTSYNRDNWFEYERQDNTVKDHGLQQEHINFGEVPDSSLFNFQEEGQSTNTQAPFQRRTQSEGQTRVTWSSSTPLRRPSSLERGRRRIPASQGIREPSGFSQSSRSNISPGPDREEETGDRGEDNQTKVTRVLEMITEQLLKNRSTKANSHPSIKLPQMTLPTPTKKSATGEVSTKSYYLWKCSLATALQNHSLDPKAILLLYSTNEKLLPVEWQSIFASSSTLKEAICGLDLLFPPLSSVHPEIVRSMTNLPVLNSPSEKTKVFRISTLLRSLEQLIKLFGRDPSKDLSRQETMVIIYGLSSTNESRAELVTEIGEMDGARRRGVLYAHSLRNYLLRSRMILTDVIAAVQIVGRTEGGDGKVKSAAAQHRQQEKGKEGKKDITCLLCPKAHATFACKEQLALVQSGQRTLPASICRICLRETGEKHPKVCGEKRYQKDGVYQIINFRCIKGCGINHRLCSCKAGPSISIDKDQTPSQKKASAATRVVELLQEEEASGGGEEADSREERGQVFSAAAKSREVEGEVIFQIENVLLQGRDKTTFQAVASFDTHGSSHFVSGDIPDNYNHSDFEEDRTFEIDTIHGKSYTQHQVLELKILTLKGPVHLQAIRGSWINPKEEGVLDQETAARFGISTPELEDCEGRALPRIIIGCSKLNSLHPRSIAAPPGFNLIHPNLACFRSRIGQGVLCAGAKGAGTVTRF